MEDRNVRRGDIYHADLDPVFGSEQGGYRPVLVIQNNIGNQYSPTVIVAAITSKEKMKLPTHIAVPEMEGLEKDSVVLLEQLRTLDKRRLENYVCTLDRTEMEKINKAIRRSTGIPKIIEKPLVVSLCRQRRRLMKYYFEDKNYEQIAQEEGCSFQMVAKSVKAAIRNLKKILR